MAELAGVGRADGVLGHGIRGRRAIFPRSQARIRRCSIRLLKKKRRRLPGCNPDQGPIIDQQSPSCSIAPGWSRELFRALAARKTMGALRTLAYSVGRVPRGGGE